MPTTFTTRRYFAVVGGAGTGLLWPEVCSGRAGRKPADAGRAHAKPAQANGAGCEGRRLRIDTRSEMPKSPPRITAFGRKCHDAQYVGNATVAKNKTSPG
jgi:hypothetical protein